VVRLTFAWQARPGRPAPLALGGLSRAADYSGEVGQDLVHDGLGRKGAVQRGCAQLKHFGLEYRASLSDLLSALFVPPRRAG
jgi:hypothetical protein